VRLPNKSFCVLPWISLETSPIGTVRPCCLADHELHSDSGAVFNLASADFDTIRNSKEMQRLREQFLAGQQPETCRRCWAEESAGRTSKRLHTLDRLEHIVADTDWTPDAKPLVFLDLKLGNICNLKCRICGSWSSSTYAVEELANEPNPKSSWHYQMLRAGRWPRETPAFWAEIARASSELRYLEFTGGEPFMIQEHFDFLQRLVDLGLAGQIEIHYNTNGTHYPESAEAIWQHFRLVEIAFSIDDVADRFEYQRSGAVWDRVTANIERFRQLRARTSNIQLQVCSTVNVFNVLYLAELSLWHEQQAFDFVYWNMMHDAEYFSIASLPESAKARVAERLRHAAVAPATLAEFDRIVEFMLNGQSQDGSRTREEIRRVDQRRGENLRSAHPELADLLGYA